MARVADGKYISGPILKREKMTLKRTPADLFSTDRVYTEVCHIFFNLNSRLIVLRNVRKAKINLETIFLAALHLGNHGNSLYLR